MNIPDIWSIIQTTQLILALCSVLIITTTNINKEPLKYRIDNEKLIITNEMLLGTTNIIILKFLIVPFILLQIITDLVCKEKIHAQKVSEYEKAKFGANDTDLE